MGRAIFISYRRDDSEGEAGRLFDDLTRSLGDESVFMDVSGINPGVDFRKAIDDNVGSCGVLLAVIGPSWCSIKSTAGTRRLDDPNDFVRLEIASALARNIAVIPVLVHDAKMPHPEELPDNLKDLAYRNSVEITHARWNSDVQLLTQALQRYVAPSAPSDTKPVHATVSVQLPPPTAPAEKPKSSRPSGLPLIAGVVIAAVLVFAVLAFFLFRGSGDAQNASKDQGTTAGSDAKAGEAAAANPLAGTWNNPDASPRNGLERLEITEADRQSLTIHAWGHCGQRQCDWGTETATWDGRQAQASWQLGADDAGGEPKRTAAVTIKPANDALDVTVANSYADHPPSEHQFTFVRVQ